MGARLGIFGGTFDPIHLGHLRAVEEVAEELSLDKVLFMPCSDPPHNKRVMAGAQQRLEMVRLAVAMRPGFQASDLEIARGGASRTVDTLRQLKAQEPERELFFLIGADAFYFLHTWYEPMEILGMANFVVMDRPQAPRWDLLEYARTELNPKYEQGPDGWLHLPGGYGIKHVTTTLLDISSTDIKGRVARDMSITFLVPVAVEEYIRDMNLYTKPGQEQ